MLVRGVCYRACELDALVEKALAGAAKGVHAIGPLVASAEAGKPAGDAGCDAPGVPIVAPCAGASTSAADTEAQPPSAARAEH